MKMFLAIVVLSLASQVHAKSTSVQINCTAPNGFAGQAAIIQGTMNATDTSSDGYVLLKGNIDITIGGSSMQAVLDEKSLPVQGVELEGGNLLLEPVKESKLTTLFINFKQVNGSYVEFDGQKYLANCAE